MSMYFIKFRPCSLRSGIIAPKCLACLCGKAVQLSDTFSGHASCDGVPTTLRNDGRTENKKTCTFDLRTKREIKEN